MSLWGQFRIFFCVEGTRYSICFVAPNESRSSWLCTCIYIYILDALKDDKGRRYWYLRPILTQSFSLSLELPLNENHSHFSLSRLSSLDSFSSTRFFQSPFLVALSDIPGLKSIQVFRQGASASLFFSSSASLSLSLLHALFGSHRIFIFLE